MKHRKDSQSADTPQAQDFLEIVEFRDTALLSYVTSAVIVPGYDAVKRDFGVIRAEYLLLMCLAHYEVLTAQDVSRLTGRPRNSISRAVHRMLKEGYLNRVPDPDDGRQSKLTITAKGRVIHNKIAEYIRIAQEDVLTILNEQERNTLSGLLKKCARYAASKNM